MVNLVPKTFGTEFTIIQLESLSMIEVAIDY